MMIEEKEIVKMGLGGMRSNSNTTGLERMISCIPWVGMVLKRRDHLR